MNIYKHEVTFDEVPDHVSMTFYVAGCPNNCPNCFWDKGRKSYELTVDMFEKAITTNGVDCVTFLGGEWEPVDLAYYLWLAWDYYHLKTCLYTGKDCIEDLIYSLGDSARKVLRNLSYLKIGSYKEELGSLTSPTTNQKLIDLYTGKQVKMY